MVDGVPDPSSFRLSAKRALKLTKSKGKDEATAIEVPSSPSVVSVRSSTPGNNEDEDDLEEVAIPGGSSAPLTPMDGNASGLDTQGTMDSEAGYLTEEEDEEAQVIRLEIGGETLEEKAKRIELAMRKKPMTAKDRARRMEIHKLHTVSLLASARIRNRWASDQLLQARLLSLLPHPLHAALSIPRKRFPDRAQRSRLFFDALQSLVTWWSQSFFDISDPTLGARTRTWDEVQEVIDSLPRINKSDIYGGTFTSRFIKQAKDRKGKGKAKEMEEVDPMMESLAEAFGGERLRSVNSMMKKVLQQEGSRDVSAQLFVALARACGLGARLVVSIQAVPWRAEKAPTGKKKVGAGSGGRTMASRQGVGHDVMSEEEELEEVPIPGVDEVASGSGKKEKKKKSKQRGGHIPKTADPADLYRLRPQRPAPQTVGSKPRRKTAQDMITQPPVFWAEVYSRSDQRWIPVDPVSGVIRKKALYDPSSDSGLVRMVYVVAFEEDGYARDVTLRYAKNFGARTSKLRPPSKPGDPAWWSDITRMLQRPQRLNRDDLEDAELEMTQINEGMPLHMTGFKDHPLYVLERHLRQDEVILPKREIGRFKGEAVYRRSNVLQCKTAETWMRSGRQIKPRQEPLKWVKQRAVTIQKRRAQAQAAQEGQEPALQGLYAEYQTQLYRPPPIKDGIVPQNAFGNIDLYVPSMLPEGAVHLTYKGIGKVAKQLKVSYAEAVTSFEFRSQRAHPVITGIVVAKENESKVLEAYWKSAAVAEEREKLRREHAAIKRWVKLVNGMRVRRRLRAEYGGGEELHERQLNPMAKDEESAPAEPARTAMSIIAAANEESAANHITKIRLRLPTPPMEDTKPDVPEEDVEPEVEVEAATNRTGRPRRSNGVTTVEPTPARTSARNGKAAKAKTKSKGKQNGRKRKAESDESEAEDTESDTAPIPSRKGRAAPEPAPTRTLRSRTSKTEAQMRAMAAALASDVDEDDE